MRCPYVYMWLFLAVLPVAPANASDEFVDGELIIWFHNEDSTVITITDSTVTCADDSLQDIFDDFGLVNAMPLFRPKSLLRNVFALEFPPSAPLDSLIGLIGSLQTIRSVTKNWIAETDSSPNDYAFNHDYLENGHTLEDGRPDQWAFIRTQVDRAWNLTTGDSAVVVAILDDGLDWEHPDLDGNLWINADEDINGNGKFDNFPDSLGGDLNGVDDDVLDSEKGMVDDVIGWNFWDLGPDPQHRPTTEVQPSHGTAMASIISAETNNDSVGVAGTTWHSRLMALRVGRLGNIDLLCAISGTNYAIDHGADVVNMSFSFGQPNEPHFSAWASAITRGDSAGVIFVASAGVRPGTEGIEEALYPCAFDEVICVGAVDSVGFKRFSNFGDQIDMCAPSAVGESVGRGIVTCRWFTGSTGNPEYPTGSEPHRYYFTAIATSGAAAQVSGAAALLRAIHPNESPAFIKSELFRGAMALPDSLYAEGKLGAGMLNAYSSLTQWGEIDADTTWSGTVYVSGDIRVKSGTTLTIDPGTTIYVWPDDINHAHNPASGSDSTRIEFDVVGSIAANGTAQDSVRFVAWDPSGTTDDPDAWFGIFVADTSDAGTYFDHTVFRNADRGIQGGGDITIRNCTFDDCEIGISAYFGDSLYVEDSVIRDAVQHGLNLLNGTRLRFSGSTVEGTQGSGVAVYSSAKLYAHNATFKNNDIGVLVYPGGTPTPPASVELTSCEISDNVTGVEVDGISGVTVQGSVISGNSVDGVFTHNEADIELRGNTIKDNATGVHSRNSSPELRGGNVVELNTVGILCDSTSFAVVESTVVDANDVGVLVKNSSSPSLGIASGNPSLGNNIFTNDSTYAVQNLTTSTVRAEQNFWGLVWPDSSRLVGDVDYTPWDAPQWGAITTDTTWSRRVILTGDVRVASGATLTVAAGTSVLVWPNDINHSQNPVNGSDTTRVEFRVKGALDVNGTVQDSVRFFVWDGTQESQETSEWFGILVLDSSDGGTEFDYTTIRNAKGGIQGYGDLIITNSTLEDCEIGLSVYGGDSVYVDNTVIRRSELLGVNVLLGTRLRIENSVIEHGEGSGIEAYSGARLYAEETDMKGNNTGVWIYPGGTPTPAATAELAFCRVEDNYTGVSVEGISGVTIRSCVIADNVVEGVLVSDGADIELRANNIKDNAVGVFAFESAPQLRRGNVIKSNLSSGITCDDTSHAVIESTTVEFNAVGVIITDASQPNLGWTNASSPSAGRNIFTNESTMKVYNLTSNYIRAERNYWGVPWPDSTKFVGSLDYTPFLIHKPDNGPEPFEDPGEAPLILPADNLPPVFELSEGRPNPFNPTTRLDFQVPSPGGRVVITVYNVKGQRVTTLVDRESPPGIYTTLWDGRNARGAEVATGVYFVQMRAPSFKKTRKIVFLK